MNWLFHVKVKHLFTDKEDWESVQNSMKAVADTLKNEPCFYNFNFKKFYTIPKGDEVFGPVDYANKLLARLYDYADDQAIWIG